MACCQRLAATTMQWEVRRRWARCSRPGRSRKVTLDVCDAQRADHVRRFRSVGQKLDYRGPVTCGRRRSEPPYLAQPARTCIYGHLEERNADDPAVPHLETDDNVPGRDHKLGRPHHAMSVIPALAL